MITTTISEIVVELISAMKLKEVRFIQNQVNGIIKEREDEHQELCKALKDGDLVLLDKLISKIISEKGE